MGNKNTQTQDEEGEALKEKVIFGSREKGEKKGRERQESRHEEDVMESGEEKKSISKKNSLFSKEE